MKYDLRDFIETAEGLVFAVVDSALEDGKVLAMLRYIRDDRDKAPRKVDTAAAIDFLRRHHPNYQHHSARLAASLHGVPEARVVRHYRARERLLDLTRGKTSDVMEQRLCRLLQHFTRRGLDLSRFGVTGSLLIGAHTSASDLDLVVYGRPSFSAARMLIASGLAEGIFSALDEAAWNEAYRRRGCALTFEEFVWHERRKTNKALFERTKFDLTLVPTAVRPAGDCWRKIGRTAFRATVLDASAAFDSPAVFRTDHPQISEIHVLTHTYVGQAFRGELIEAAGFVEQGADGRCRLVVGTSREAPGEFIRVLRAAGQDRSQPAA